MPWNRGTTRVTTIAIVETFGIIITLILTTMIMTMPLFTKVIAQQENNTEVQQDTEFRVQNTTMSIPAPNANINNQTMPHQIVIALPLRQDGKIWTGTATFTASKPIEIEVLHKYNPKVLPDAKHGEPYHAKWIDGITPIALSTMTMFSNTPVSVTNSPISTGSFVFTGSVLLFHKTDGQPFTVTYTIDATAKSLTR
ncbi:MAG TPA: hypothetical protein VJ729_11395 [Nitrososphaeraceae archaeon]|nr:hypothetical protein [Nitrososphaeraceae archaeon]